MRAFAFPALIAASLVFVSALAARDDRPERNDGSRRGDDHRLRGRVTFYEHADFRGTYFVLDAGEQMSNLTRQQFANGARANDRISSVRIEGDVEVVLFRDANFRGGEVRLTHSVHNLNEVESGWNDVVSSVRVDTARGDRPGRR